MSPTATQPVRIDGEVRELGALSDSRRRKPIGTDRLRTIADLVRQHGSVRASDVVTLLGVTDETVRRDLRRLESMGLVERVHGGAVAVGPVIETTYAGRLLEHQAEKIAIANFAATLVGDGESLIVDAGTTTLYLVRALRLKRDLTVATNAVTHGAELIKNQRTSLILIGGMVRASTFATVGDIATAALRDLHVQRTFLAAYAVSARLGITNPGLEEVGVKRAMIEAASETVLLVDHSKLSVESLIRVAPVTAITRIITSDQADPEEVDRIRALGVDVVMIPIPGATTNKSRADEQEPVTSSRSSNLTFGG